jgi:soluble lytic murein transglycosylase-like protein
VRAATVLLWFVAASHAEDPYEASRAAMEASIDKQRASVMRQLGSAEPAAGSFLVLPWPEPPLHCAPVPPDQIASLIEEIAEREGLTPDLLRAIIRKESAFRPCAVSRKGAQGLMQLMPDTARELGVEDPFNPRQNIGGGARFLRQMLDRFGGSLPLALGAYNAGPGHVDPQLGLPLFPETLNYVSDILKMIDTGQ